MVKFFHPANRYFFTLITCFLLMQDGLIAQSTTSDSDEIYRPQIHFSPGKHWMNDPNGLVYYNHLYHLFYQYHPYSSVWGPMHWGHASSTDLVHWKRLPIALYPDSIGMIFSGSAVLDQNNTSGFGRNGKPPLVAVFTQHDANGEHAGRNNFQTQSLAFSLDNGQTWTKYSGNPVLKNPGITDFRDPKLMWYAPSHKWILTLATKDIITFYSSGNLKSWKKESEFGKDIGAHGGVWECPDLFPMDDNGRKKWVLIVNLNPGGPNQGSATQYFIGRFDGRRFLPDDTVTRWLDYGPDEYAGVTWSNTGNRRIFIGWMSNWLYANKVPTETWRNAMTIPRELELKHAGTQLLLASRPVSELSAIETRPMSTPRLDVENDVDLRTIIGSPAAPFRLGFEVGDANDFSVVLSNNEGEKLSIGYDQKQNRYFIDRSKSGKTGFQKDFGSAHTAPRFAVGRKIKIEILVDVSSVELFADDGLTVMTEIFFPGKPYDQLHIQSPEKISVDNLQYRKLKSIW